MNKSAQSKFISPEDLGNKELDWCLYINYSGFKHACFLVTYSDAYECCTAKIMTLEQFEEAYPEVIDSVMDDIRLLYNNWKK